MSLRTALFLWLLGPLVGLGLLGSLAAVAIVRNVTQAHYDEELLDTALSINVFVHEESGRLAIAVNEVEQRALLFDSYDDEIFAVRDDSGSVIAGSPDLPRPPVPPSAVDVPVYFDAIYRGRPMRWIAITTGHAAGQSESDARRAHITVGETRNKRDVATRAAVLYVAAPQLAVVVGLALLAWFGIGRGLRPMHELTRRLRQRSASDLDPIGAGRAPEEIRAVTEELDRLLGRLKESIQQQSNFIGDAAHQLRTPLAALKASAQYLQRHRHAEDRERAVQRVVETADRCIRVVNQLLSLARADVAQTGGVTLQQVDVVALCEEIVADSVDAALTARVDLGIEADPSVQAVEAEPTLLREALRNLVDNAIQHTPAGGRVTVQAAPSGDGLRIAVVDSGPGIPAADRARVFERFQRGEDAGSTGSGLGLPIARLCARAMGGSVDYFEPAGGGAGFVIELPVAVRG